VATKRTNKTKPKPPKKKEPRLRDCRRWPHCRCIMQGKEGRDCSTPDHRSYAEHLLDDY
jgi:hypothetical protein